MTNTELGKTPSWVFNSKGQGVEKEGFEWLHHAFGPFVCINSVAAAASAASGPWTSRDEQQHLRLLIEVMESNARHYRPKSVPMGVSGLNDESHVVINHTFFRRLYEADPLDQVDIVKRGVNARMVDILADSMQMPKEKLMSTLGLARATVQRKSSQQKTLSKDESSRVVGIGKLIGQAQAMLDESGDPDGFDTAAWVARWLDQPLPALGGRRPAEFMDTAEGQAIVSQLLGRLQSGAYA